MALEDAIAKLTAAVEANTAALNKAGGTASTGTTTKATTTKSTKAETPAKPKHDRSAVNAALEKVKDEKGVEDAKKIITDAGGVAARKDIPEDKFDAVVAACEKALEAGAGSNDDDDL